VPLPALSVVCVAGEQRRRVHRCLEALATQTVADRIEVVVVDVATTDEPVVLPRELESSTVIRPEAGATLGQARAIGARAARGEAVAFLVDHGYPEPRWAEGVIDAYAEPWAAVGYAFAPANPETQAVRATMLAQFLPWLSPAQANTIRSLPGNMVSYRSSLLRSFDGDLEGLLEIDHLLHERIHDRGEAMAVAPGAVVRDECFESVAAAARANHVYSEMLAVQRAHAHGWSLVRRIVYALGSPVGVFAMRSAQALADAGRTGRLPALARALPRVLAILAMAALGEARGYLRETKSLRDRFLWWELNAPRARR
jgi:glycosyltransferase involved in cell wall biosynthesis